MSWHDYRREGRGGGATGFFFPSWSQTIRQKKREKNVPNRAKPCAQKQHKSPWTEERRYEDRFRKL
jgi:hypothetical protein